VFATDRQKSLTAGANEFLPKPIQEESLLTALQSQLNLEWIYEEKKITEHKQPGLKPVEADASQMVYPPIDVLQMLYDLARRGLINNLMQEAERLEQQNGELSLFTQQIRKYAKGFQLKQIRGFLEDCLNQA
jgi:hypothetical protein